MYLQTFKVNSISEELISLMFSKAEEIHTSLNTTWLQLKMLTACESAN